MHAAGAKRSTKAPLTPLPQHVLRAQSLLRREVLETILAAQDHLGHAGAHGGGRRGPCGRRAGNPPETQQEPDSASSAGAPATGDPWCHQADHGDTGHEETVPWNPLPSRGTEGDSVSDASHRRRRFHAGLD